MKRVLLQRQTWTINVIFQALFTDTDKDKESRVQIGQENQILEDFS